MATNVTIYRGNNGRYYTPEGLVDYLTYGAGSSFTYSEVEATRYTVTFRLMDGAAGTLYNPLGSGTGNSSHTRTENGKSVKYYTADNAAAEIVVPIYKVSGTAVLVYGAHPSHPGMSGFYSYMSARVVFKTANAARYVYNGAYTVNAADLSHVAANLASGSDYNADKIIYNNANNYLLVGANVTPLDGTLYIYAGYYWFLCLSQNAVTLAASANSHTRTVADGKKYASILDIPDYNSGSNASLSVKTSTGSLTFPYKQVLRRGLGSFLPGGNTRILTAFEGVDSANNTAVVLSGANTKADGSGIQVSVGDDIADLLTRNPSLVDFDTRGQLYAFWKHRYAITVDADGGTGGTSSFYFCPEDTSFFSDAAQSNTISSITAPVKDSAALVGLYDGTTLAVNANGQIVDGWTPAADTTLTAHWRTVVDVAFSKGDGTGGDDGIVYDSAAGGFCRRGTETVITSVYPPRLECWQFLGYFSAASGGTQLIDADGTILPALVALGEGSPSTIYAQWQRVSYRLDVNAQGGAGGGPIYCDGTNAAFYADDLLTNELDAYPIPELTGYDFLGCYTAATGGDLRIDPDGGLSALPVFSTDGGVIYAQWQAHTFTLTFNYAGGAGSTDSKTVTYDAAIGTLPTPSSGPKADATFKGWTVGGVAVTAATIWQFNADMTAFAVWETSFGNVEDFFNMGTAALVPIRSSNGDMSPYERPSNAGRYNTGVGTGGGIWRNPSVTYLVVADTSILITFGKAYRGSAGVSGYFITSAQIDTSLGAFPTVTVTGTANEGADAINTFHLALSLRARARAQNLMSAIVGGGELHSCSLTASCQPVVLTENMMPCASDVVDGKISVSASTCAMNGEAAPTAGGGFALRGSPKQSGDTVYTNYDIQLEKEMT